MSFFKGTFTNYDVFEYFPCMCVDVCMYECMFICMYTVFEQCPWRPLEIELQMIVSYHVVAGNCTQVLCKSSPVVLMNSYRILEHLEDYNIDHLLLLLMQ